MRPRAMLLSVSVRDKKRTNSFSSIISKKNQLSRQIYLGMLRTLILGHNYRGFHVNVASFLKRCYKFQVLRIS